MATTLEYEGRDTYTYTTDGQEIETINGAYKQEITISDAKLMEIVQARLEMSDL